MRDISLLFRSLIIVVIAFTMHSCSAEEDIEKKPLPIAVDTGDWMVYFNVGENEIPINLEFFKQENGLIAANIINAKEKIAIEKITIENDSMVLEMPMFNSKFFTRIHSNDSLTGFWINYNKSSEYKIPVLFIAGKKSRFTGKISPHLIKEKWKVTFSPDKEGDTYDAIGIFNHQEGNSITGTFLTETGDYRFLDGNIIGDSLMLSCFDGAHLFLFKARLNGDSLLGGEFYSGNHYSDTWEGVVNYEYELRDPNAITSIINDKRWQDVKIKSIEGKELVLDDLNLDNKVSIIQIMGTWCPNCIDESIYFKELYQQYGKDGLSILPICFEKEELAIELMKKYKKRLELPYPVYLGGNRSKKEALKAFPMLNDIISFPTSLVIDKKGDIRKIHTGFYGPGTGEYYTNYTREMDSFISTLLKE